MKFNFVKALLLECHLRCSIVYSNHKNTTPRLIPGRFRRIPHLDEALAPADNNNNKLLASIFERSATVKSFRELNHFSICLRTQLGCLLTFHIAPDSPYLASSSRIARQSVKQLHQRVLPPFFVLSPAASQPCDSTPKSLENVSQIRH